MHEGRIEIRSPGPGQGTEVEIRLPMTTVPEVTAIASMSASVTASTGCTWTAVSNVPWITVTSGASGNGDGVVQGTIEPNGTGAPRTGTLTVAGVTVTVNQVQQ